MSEIVPDYDTDDYSSEEDGDEEIINKVESTDAIINSISTEGITDDELLKKKYNKSQIKKCEFCFKNYAFSMIVDPEAAEIMCWHCLFWLNYDVNARKDVDGNLGMTIAEYILQCHEVHNEATCTRKTEQGGCFLCEYKSGYIFNDINELWKIYDLNKISNDAIRDSVTIKDEDNYFIDEEDEVNMTIYI